MVTTTTMLDFFPLSQPREKQVKAVQFIQAAIERGYKHIVVSAPTGTGKTAIGATLCLWAASQNASSLRGEPGGYYLVTQKMLQDQLEKDFVKHPQFGCASLKSAASYECDDTKFKNCEIGRIKKCACTKYMPLKEQFLASKIGVTNYSYFITEKLNVGKMPTRRVMVLDECHNIERLLVRFFDVTVGQEQLDDVEVLDRIPEFSDIHQFINWCNEVYMPRLKEKAENLISMVHNSQRIEYADKAMKLAMQLQKLCRALDSMTANPQDWVFWSQEDQKIKGKQYIARPLYAHEFTSSLFGDSDVILHMSAFPGDKITYCQSLGLDPNDVAWIGLGSTFPVENRPIHIASVGSMSMRNIDATLPVLIKYTIRIMDKFHDKKGLIHCNSYKVGQALYDALNDTAHSNRVIYPKSAEEREQAFNEHANSKMPTVIISPSMTEGFDFAGTLAEWQIIAKVPFPNMGDKHTCKRKDVDDNWYKMETIKTIVQACGRIVRSETDKGTTYIMDSDINRLLDYNSALFPKWWLSAMIRR
jgi:ATP-dependent DNA helicase DinG